MKIFDFFRRRKSADISTKTSSDDLNIDEIIPAKKGTTSALPMRTNTISKRFKSVLIDIPDTLDVKDIRMVFGEARLMDDSFTAPDMDISRLKGVRWRYQPLERTIVIEGHSDKRIERAVTVFRNRLIAQANCIG